MMVALMPLSKAYSRTGTSPDLPGEDFFSSTVPLSFEGGDANLTRYVGNEPVNNTDPTGLQKNNSVANVGQVLLTSDQGKPFPVNIVGMDKEKGEVTIEYTVNGVKQSKPLAIAGFAKEDQDFLKNLQIVPPNVVIDPKSVSGVEAKSAWVKGVVNDIAVLNGLAKGKEILDGIRKVGATCETEIPIVPSTRTVKGKPDSRMEAS